MLEDPPKIPGNPDPNPQIPCADEAPITPDPAPEPEIPLDSAE
jgi:hypothetical protein